METTVSEIHAYPRRPAGYEEPLFHTRRSRKEILDHLAKSGWLCRASEIEPRVVGARRGGVSKRRATGGRPAGRAGRPAGRVARAGHVGRVGRVLASWREVDRWWEANGGVDVVWRLLQYESGCQKVRAEPIRAEPARAEPVRAYSGRAGLQREA